jgi:hypothetical protein
MHYLTNIKHFPCWYTVISTRMHGNWENEELCGNTTPEGRSVFIQFRVFPISTSVDICTSIRKNVLYFYFYNIAQRNIKKDILSYINTALSQSAFRIYKCYIIITIIEWGWAWYELSSPKFVWTMNHTINIVIAVNMYEKFS